MQSIEHHSARFSLLSRCRIALIVLLLGCLLLGAANFSTVPKLAVPAPIVLYDGALGSMPDDQGFTFLALPNVAPTISGGATILNTSSDKNIFAGYFSKSDPQLVLDRAIGYTVSFTVQV